MNNKITNPYKIEAETIKVGKTDIGKEIYTNYNGKKGTIVGEKDGYILVKPDDSNIRTDLYTKDQWDRITTKQNEYIADAKRVEARKIEATKQETLNQQKQADIKKRREAIVDYTGTTPMQRGRIDKMLSKEVSVWGKTGTLDEVIAAHNPRGKIQYRDGTYGLVLDDNSKVFNIPKTIWDRMNLDEISRNAFGEEKLVRKAIKNSPSVDTNLPKAVSNNSIPQTRENRIIPRVGDTPLPLKKEVIIGDTTPLKKGNTRPDPLTTVSGRKIQLDQYNPKGRDPSAKWNATLIDAAIEEAKLRNDSMNLGIFEDMKGTSYKNISQSDLSGIHQYLFDSPDSIKLTYGNKPTPAQVGKTDPLEALKAGNTIGGKIVTLSWNNDKKRFELNDKSGLVLEFGDNYDLACQYHQDMERSHPSNSYESFMNS